MKWNESCTDLCVLIDNSQVMCIGLIIGVLYLKAKLQKHLFMLPLNFNLISPLGGKNLESFNANYIQLSLSWKKFSIELKSTSRDNWIKLTTRMTQLRFLLLKEAMQIKIWWQLGETLMYSSYENWFFFLIAQLTCHVASGWWKKYDWNAKLSLQVVIQFRYNP